MDSIDDIKVKLVLLGIDMTQTTEHHPSQRLGWYASAMYFNGADGEAMALGFGRSRRAAWEDLLEKVIEWKQLNK